MNPGLGFRVPPARTLALLCLVLSPSGCGSGFKTVPVSGRVFVNGQPLINANATVMFRPDASKRNTTEIDFSGRVDRDGNYTLYYGSGNSGVALGWYKVAVVATESPLSTPAPDKTKRPKGPPPLRKSLIDTKYTLPTSSGIEIEVVENPAPGAYDLDLKPAKQK
jgi:hypothetical protein